MLFPLKLKTTNPLPSGFDMAHLIISYNLFLDWDRMFCSTLPFVSSLRNEAVP